jgi:dihydropteroate synthase
VSEPADTVEPSGDPQSRDATPVSAPRVWRCGRFDLALDRPLVMGILNVTPDSFSDGGEHENPASAVSWGERLIGDGAAILDIGGESTRPGASPLPPAGELARVRPVVRRFASDDEVPVSIDTRNASVASACIEAGASIINDVSGFRSRDMVEVAAGCEAGLVIMHMLGEPGTMQDAPQYFDVVTEVGGYLLAQAAVLEAAGVAHERIAIDPGIGFGKTLEHNLELLHALPQLAALGYPVVIGVSRKRFIGELTGVAEPSERVAGSVEAAVWAAARGADVVRVHDVGATVQALAMATALG